MAELSSSLPRTVTTGLESSGGHPFFRANFLWSQLQLTNSSAESNRLWKAGSSPNRDEKKVCYEPTLAANQWVSTV